MKEISLTEFKEWDKLSSNSYEATSVIFKLLTDSFPKLKELRDFVEQNCFGFGEREFMYMHKMIVDSFEKKDLVFMEIGVFRGQILTLYGLLRELSNKNIEIIGISPLDSTGGHWESDYEKDLQIISDQFNVPVPTIFKGLSTNPDIIKKCSDLHLDILYIDGGHSYDIVVNDLINYLPLVNKQGILVIDDSANNLPGCYPGRFWGIAEVSKAVDSLLPPFTPNDKWEYIGNIIHNRIWKRI